MPAWQERNMEEVTRDRKQPSTKESKQSEQKTSGWIRLHTDEEIQSPPVNETPVEKTGLENKKESRRTNGFLENDESSKNP